tara:strand:+ start:14119 stop:14970 length:852 start_codon:yes stop_codon:yes gene_type:complete
MTEYTNTKIVAAGQIVRVTRYLDEPVAYNFKRKKEIPIEGMSTRAERRRVAKEVYWTPERLEKERELNRKKAMISAASRLRDWVNANAWQYRDVNGRLYLPVFVTLTFREDVRDIETANEIFTLFIKRLNFFVLKDKRAELKYVNVIEFQDKTRDGVIHYHTLFFNLPFVYKKKLEKIWDQGFVKIKKVDKVKNLAGYMTKYMVKGFDDPRLDGKKRYFPSRNLIKPTVIRDELTAKAVLFQLPEKNLHKVREFESVHVGKVKAMDFILDKGETLQDVIDFVI